jgi:hypothetical protein
VRWAIAVIVVAVAGAVAAVVLGLSTGDSRPTDVADCVAKDGGLRARGEEGLQLAREDIRAGTLRPARRYDLGGGDAAVLLRGTGYRVLVVGVPGGPPLRGADLAFRIYRRTSSFAGVFTERDPLQGVLDRCARAAAG